MRKSKAILLAAISLVVALMGIFANIVIQISPEDAVSNTSKWIHALGINPPIWMQSQNTDHIVRWAALGLIALGGISFLFTVITIIRNKNHAGVSRATVSVGATIPATSGFYLPEQDRIPSFEQVDQIMRYGHDFFVAVSTKPGSAEDAENLAVKGSKAMKLVYAAYVRSVLADGVNVVVCSGWPPQTVNLLNEISGLLIAISRDLGWHQVLQGYDAKIGAVVNSSLAVGTTLDKSEKLASSLNELWKQVQYIKFRQAFPR